MELFANKHHLDEIIGNCQQQKLERIQKEVGTSRVRFKFNLNCQLETITYFLQNKSTSVCEMKVVK